MLWRVFLLVWSLTLSLCLLGLCCWVAHAAHTRQTQWTAGYTSASGMSCCTPETDCTPAAIRVLSVQGEQTTVEINGVPVTVPSKSVHVSETAGAYWCTRSLGAPPANDTVRCVFVAIGG